METPQLAADSSARRCSAVVCKSVLKTVLKNAVEYAEAKCLPGPATIADWKRFIAKFDKQCAVDKHAAFIDQTTVADCASCKVNNWCPFSCLYDGRKPCPFYEKSADQPNAAGQGRREAPYPEPDGSAFDSEEPDDREERCDSCGETSRCLMNGLCPMCYELNGGTHD